MRKKQKVNFFSFVRFLRIKIIVSLRILNKIFFFFQSRLYARYFNGDLEIHSIDGYGTDAYIYLQVIIKENIPNSKKSNLFYLIRPLKIKPVNGYQYVIVQHMNITYRANINQIGQKRNKELGIEFWLRF